jgi:hypothetical protein
MTTNTQTRATIELNAGLGFFGQLVRRFRAVRTERAMLEINRHRPGFGGISRCY